MYEVIKGKVPIRIKQLFPKAKKQSGHYTRQDPNIRFAHMNTLCISKNSFLHQCPLLWLELDQEIRLLLNKQTFKIKIRKLMLSGY